MLSLLWEQMLLLLHEQRQLFLDDDDGLLLHAVPVLLSVFVSVSLFLLFGVAVLLPRVFFCSSFWRCFSSASRFFSSALRCFASAASRFFSCFLYFRFSYMCVKVAPVAAPAKNPTPAPAKNFLSVTVSFTVSAAVLVGVTVVVLDVVLLVVLGLVLVEFSSSLLSLLVVLCIEVTSGLLVIKR